MADTSCAGVQQLVAGSQRRLVPPGRGQQPAGGRRGRGEPPGGLLETIGGLLDSVAPLEQYWAFPGPEACRRARDLFASGNYERFASLVARVSRALITESYRAGAAWSVIDETRRGRPGRDRGRAWRSPARPYFEVLVVETLTPGPGAGPARGGAQLAQAV